MRSRSNVTRNLWFPALLISSALGCNETPASGTLDDLTIEVESKLANTDAVKLDILWVIANSTSMCQEQNSLADNVKRFVDTFAQFNVDLRMAVINNDGISDKAQGRFYNELFKGPFPPACFEGQVASCLNPADCVGAFGEDWTCNPPLSGNAQYLQNKNCSINSECRYTCSSDEDCRAQFQDETMRCISPGGEKSASRCQKPPVTQDCPEELPLFVSTEDDNIDLFRCMAVVGAVQTQSSTLEQGLNCAVWALDKAPQSGAPDRSQQARSFLRDDAYQLVIFVDDEDDCSMSIKDGKLQNVPKEQWSTCSCLDDQLDGGPLASVSGLAARLRSINPDQSKVLVAAIVGDVVVGDQGGTQCLNCPDDTFPDADECVAAKRSAFTESKCGTGPVAQNTYACESESGQADYARRYIDFVRQFGDNGVLANICNDSGFGPALDQIANEVLTKLVRFCLARPVKPGTSVRVTLVDSASNEAVVLKEGEDYEVREALDCPDGSAKRAVFFSQRLESGQEVTVVYEASIF